MATIPDWAVPIQQEPEKPKPQPVTNPALPSWAVPIEQNSFVTSTPEISTKRQPPSISQGVPAWKHQLAGIAAPMLEAVGMMGGAVVGTAKGGPAGSALGAGMGYAAGNNAADRFSEWLGLQEPMSFTEQTVKMAKDVPVGAAYEVGGIAAVKVLGGGYRWASNQLREFATSAALTKTTKARKAGRILKATTSPEEIYSRNADEAFALHERVGGPNYTRGQATNDPQARAFEASRGNTPGEQVSGLMMQRAEGQQAGRDYLTRTTGGGNIDDFIAGIQAYQTRLDRTIRDTQRGVDALVSKMGSGRDQIAAGSTIAKQAQHAKDLTRLRAGELYDMIPDVPLKSDGLAQAVRNLRADFDPLIERGATFPRKLVSGIERKITAEVDGEMVLQDISFSDLRKLRTTIMTEKRSANAAGSGRLAERLNRLQDAVEESIDTIKNVEGGPGELYEQASKFYRESYVEIFKKGTMKDVLAKDATGAAKVRNSQVASRFFQPGPVGVEVAEDFLKAVGNDDLAKSAIRDAISHEAIGKITNESGEVVTRKLNMFLKQYGPALKKYGLDVEFKDLKQAQSAVDGATETLSLFNHSAAVRVLQADPEKVVAEAFKGRDMVNPGKTAQDLLDMVRGNQPAESGMKTAIVNHIVKSAETNGIQMGESAVLSQAAMKKAIAKYAPVLRTIYRNEPEKIRAMMDMRRHLEVLARNEVAPTAGSQTRSNEVYSVSRLLGPALFQRYALNNALQLAGKLIGTTSDDGVQALLNRSAVDPDLAYWLMGLSTGKVTPDRFTSAMKGHITAVSLYSMKEAAEELAREPEPIDQGQ